MNGLVVRALVDPTYSIPAWLKWRIVRPYRQLRKQGVNANTTWLNVLEMPDERVDILVIPRLIVGEQSRKLVETWFEHLRRKDITIVFEADDDIWSESYIEHIVKISTFEKSVDATRASIIGLLGELEQRADAARWIVKQVDAVTVSTNVLAEYVKTYTDKPVYVIPNAIDVDMYEAGLRKIDKVKGVVTVGWLGGRRDINELNIMIEAWKIVAIKCPNVIFVVTKWLQTYLDQFEVFTDKVVGVEWEDYESYARNLQVDIGCCAVDDSGFCSRKSPIKAWEFSLAGALVIGTDNLYKDAGFILTTNDIDTYAALIKYYVDNPRSRKAIAQVQRNHTLSFHNLKFEASRWIEVYEQIIGSKVNDSKKVAV